MKLSKFDYANAQGGCCSNLCSVFCKKLKESRRRTFVTFLEIFIPIMFMFLGTYFSTFDKYFQSESKVLSPDQYPLKQRILMNESPISNRSDISPEILA